MRSFASLKKNELLDIAKENKIKINTKMTKSDLIAILTDSIDISKHNKEKKKLMHKIVDNPIKNIKAKSTKNITILAQSSNKFLMIWNADDILDEKTQAWKISNNGNFSVLLPSYSRSVFLDSSALSKTIYISRISDNGKELLYSQYKYEDDSRYKNFSQLSEEEMKKIRYSHFSAYTKNNYSSSDNNFRRYND